MSGLVRNKFSNPPLGNIHVAFSGGRTSGYMLYRLLEGFHGTLPSNVKVVFANTGREMPETLDFVRECSIQWGVPITWVEFRLKQGKYTYEVVNHNSASRSGEPFEALIEHKTFLPCAKARFCTAELKVRTSGRYLRANGWGTGWTTALGIRADEPKRLITSSDHWVNWYPLNEESITKSIVSEFWRSNTFDLQLPNKNGKTLLGNCDGCFLKSEANLAELYRRYPERYKWWIDMENKFSSNDPSSRATKEGARFKLNMTYKSLSDFIDQQGDWIFDEEQFGEGGILCQANDGECTG